MTKTIELQITPEFANSMPHLIEMAAHVLNVQKSELSGINVEKRSLDGRSKIPFYRCRVKVFINEQLPSPIIPIQLKNVSSAQPVLILGAGPAGIFAALELISLGLKPIILERGKAVRERRRDLALISREGKVDPESNYCYGEGGAGTYSDGKLYTRSGKKEDLNRVLQILVHFGAPDSILADARPHIGTNKLPGIITAIREAIVACGGEVHFNTRVDDISIKSGSFQGFIDQSGAVWKASSGILAGGHSARELFYLFNRKGILLEAKGFALGVRIEHDQQLINRLQYHAEEPDPYLPPANYQLVEQVGSRGVFSFCMCPGGIIAPCATGPNEVVVNGWSPSKRNNPWANSGMVVQINEEDVKSGSNPLALLEFQMQIEKAAYNAGGRNLQAPAQRMVDFVQGKNSASLPVCSYNPGISSSMLESFLPEIIVTSLKRALPEFGKKMKGYYTNEAVLVGVESRTSSPVRIPRSRESMEHPQISGIYPCGEGAGFAGGIMSAAIDGMYVAHAIAIKNRLI